MHWLLPMLLWFVAVHTPLAHAILYRVWYISDYCSKEVYIGNGYRTGILRATKGVELHSAYECFVTLRADKGFRIALSIRSIDLPDRYYGSCSGFVKFSAGRRMSDNFCGYSNDSYEMISFDSADNRFHVHLKTFAKLDNKVYQGFEVTYTTFKLGLNKTCADNSTYLCSNSHCIQDDVACDTRNNCGDRSDERFCDTLTALMIAFIVISATLLFISLVISAICLRRYRKRKAVRTLRTVSVSSVSSTVPILSPGIVDADGGFTNPVLDEMSNPIRTV